MLVAVDRAALSRLGRRLAESFGDNPKEGAPTAVGVTKFIGPHLEPGEQITAILARAQALPRRKKSEHFAAWMFGMRWFGRTWKGMVVTDRRVLVMSYATTRSERFGPTQYAPCLESAYPRDTVTVSKYIKERGSDTERTNARVVLQLDRTSLTLLVAPGFTKQWRTTLDKGGYGQGALDVVAELGGYEPPKGWWLRRNRVPGRASPTTER
jgi:hypothetical protein